jgi:hypothetical protein
MVLCVDEKRQDSASGTADRWPDAVDVGLLARYARAFANGALQLANQPRIAG